MMCNQSFVLLGVFVVACLLVRLLFVPFFPTAGAMFLSVSVAASSTAPSPALSVEARPFVILLLGVVRYARAGDGITLGYLDPLSYDCCLCCYIGRVIRLRGSSLVLYLTLGLSSLPCLLCVQVVITPGKQMSAIRAQIEEMEAASCVLVLALFVGVLVDLR